MGSSAREALAVAVLVLAACGPESPPADGGSTDAVVAPDASALVPRAPELPRTTPCPAGWIEQPEGDATTCDPYAGAGPRTDCGDDEAHFPGEAGCARIGSACAADGWPAALPTDRPILFVRAGGAGDGTTRAAPLATITAALALAAPGTIVAVAVGTYDEAIVIGAGVTVWGACAGGTRLTSSAPSEDVGVVHVSGEGAALRDVTIADAARPGMWLTEPTGTLRLDDVVVARVRSFGIAADAGRIEGRSVVVRDVELRPSDGTLGRGVASHGAAIELERVAIDRVRTTGIFAHGAGALVRASDALIRDARDRLDGQIGRGVAAQSEGRVELTRALVDRSREAGVVATSGSVIALADVVVRDTLGRDADGAHGMGLQAERGGRIEGDRVVVERSRVQAVHAGTDSMLALRDAIVRDTDVERSTGSYGRGAVAFEGGTVALTRTIVARHREVGVAAHEAGSTVTLLDVAIRDLSGSAADGRLGIGIWAQWGATVDARAVVVERARMVGIGAVGGAAITVEDAVVRDTLEAECGAACADVAAGIGLVAHREGGRVRATRFVVERAALCGVAVGREPTSPDDPGGELDLATGIVADVPIGACVQVDGYDVERLRAGVEYRGVDVPLQATSYALPSAID